MKRAAGFSSPTLLAALAAGLLAVGLAVDLGVTQPRAAETRKLARRHGELLARLGESARQERERKALSQWASATLPEALTRDGESAPPRETDVRAAEPGAAGGDPVAFLDGLLRETRLRRLELGSVRETSADGLRRSRVFVRVSGRFGDILGFIRRMEEHPRLVILDAFTIESTGERDVLDARLDVSVVDPDARIGA